MGNSDTLTRDLFCQVAHTRHDVDAMPFAAVLIISTALCCLQASEDVGPVREEISSLMAVVGDLQDDPPRIMEA
jgi:hypothetical protein